MRLLGLFFLLAGGAFAGEYAVLASGARMHIDRHEADGAKVRLYYGTGFVEMTSTMVRSFEAEDPGPVPVLTAEAVAGAAAGGPTPAPTALGTGGAAAHPYGPSPGTGAQAHACGKRFAACGP